MSLHTIKQQLQKQADRLLAKITGIETKQSELEQQKEALQAQIDGIKNAMAAIDMGEAP